MTYSFQVAVPPSSSTVVRQLLVALAGAVLLFAAALSVAPSAHAVNHEGILSVKGVGSTYSSVGSPTVALAGSSGQTLTFGVKVFNAGSDATQYNLKLSVSGLPATVGLYGGSTLWSTATTPDGYYTAPLAPQTGATYTLKVKSTLPAGAALRATVIGVTLTARDGTVLHTATVRAEQKAPIRGSAPADTTAKSGSQPYVGSHSATQYASSPLIRVGETAKFTVKLAVNAGSPHRLHAYLPVITDGQCYTVKAFAGTVDVTSSVASGAYLTRTLSPGQSSLLTIQITTMGFQFCSNTQVDIYGYTESGQSVSAVRLVAP